MSALSYLYVPGDTPARFAKAEASGASAIVFDLEDAVTPAAKEAARAQVAEHLSGRRPAGVEAWVRLNADELMARDVDAVVGPALTGVIPAKTATRHDVSRLDDLLGQAEARCGLARGRIAVAPLVESGLGLANIFDIAQGPRVTTLHLGEIDLAADLGLEPGADETELLFARSQAVVACSAAGIESPVAPVSAQFRDLEAFAASTRALRRLGFFGRACIHPAQVGAVHDVFTPTAEQAAKAADILRRLDGGSGVAVDADGRMIDEAVARQARRILAQAASAR
ncbi:CoA ester lyase [Nocardioides sp. BP30]|uniref:HpcH/HpaI aldolase/citrate lyase family protein n=1 Tax=Nocardioides sp. BP30 TaxID=3036374 RepID=UPI002469C1EE|nr:CoA ester lyase [Nocardioides sp. BP30]WGL54100.1 CoA ester lyase [Nocardioides sp. BP30]